MKRSEIVKLLEEAAIKLGDMDHTIIRDPETHDKVCKISYKEIDAMQTAIIACKTVLEDSGSPWDSLEFIKTMFTVHAVAKNMVKVVKARKGCDARD